MSRTVQNCLNCGWRGKRMIDWRCSRDQTLHTVYDTCGCWMGYYGDPLQLDYFGYQEFGQAPWSSWRYGDFSTRAMLNIVPFEDPKIKLSIGRPGQYGYVFGRMSRLQQGQFLCELAATLLSNGELFYLIRLGHPDRHGRSYGRFEIVHEISRRVPRIFTNLGWPYNSDSSYKNCYTGDVMTLREQYESRARSRDGYSYDEWLIENGAFIFEHWYPEDLWEDSRLHRDGTQMELEVSR